MVQKQTDKNDPFARISRITPRERECLELVVQRKGSKEIAAILGISPHTVDARIKSAMRKLDAASRDMAALIFIESETLGHDVTVTSDVTPWFPPAGIRAQQLCCA
ncbi:response regulator transcription factor [Sphingopyxis macrogoltabida]|uniref:Two-component system, NarL family, nitrate/nitrite response regulator NarP n=2 Tax=Sphingopyxis macrogoltabida TaxID=33050 RepID=A0AAC9AVJ6_SPHMC|nr:helix-turn-helix transcriptional regulator [Sphingopyxis macrogoltabida]ALJ12534.1 two-component system, NarL family, nitrate/nitrite response regulator NarP [Sphingopyxis macrogoltabida]AMU89990.1 two-component system, NarL family, nitrate/nitrite response regulator NarP [Sphingopyxis macrogoltabida]